MSSVVPGSSGVPSSAYPAGPSASRVATCANVSAFESTVARPRRPSTAAGRHAVTGRFVAALEELEDGAGLPADERRAADGDLDVDQPALTLVERDLERHPRGRPVVPDDHLHDVHAERPGDGLGAVEHEVRRRHQQRGVLGAGGLALRGVDDDGAPPPGGERGAHLAGEGETAAAPPGHGHGLEHGEQLRRCRAGVGAATSADARSAPAPRRCPRATAARRRPRPRRPARPAA